jgi:ABC-type transport system substrate-binding protein
MRSEAKSWISLAALIVGAALLAASALAARPAEWTLRVDLPTDVDYVDPAKAYYLPSWQILFATCLKLVNHPDGGGLRSAALVPEAAPFPRVSRDGRTYTFQVRAGFTRFSTGEAVTARAFAAALARLRDPRAESPARDLFLRDLASVRVRASTLVLRLRRPAGDFLARLAMPFFCALPEGTPAARDGIDAPIPSAGPYYVASWQRNRSLVLRRNPFYRGHRPRRPARVVYSIGNADETSRLRIWRNRADWYLAGAAASARAYQWPPVRRRTFPSSRVEFLFFDTRRGRPFANARLRRAVAFAVDRAAIASPSGNRIGRPTDSLVPATVPPGTRRHIHPLRADVRRARELVRGLVPLRVTLHQSSRYPHPLQSQLLQRQLARVGIEVDIVYGPRDRIAEPCGADLVLFGRSADYPDPAPILAGLLADLRRECGVNPAWAARFERRNRLRGSRRLAALAELERSLARAATPATALYSPSRVQYFSRRIGCVRAHAVYQVSIAALCLR